MPRVRSNNLPPIDHLYGALLLSRVGCFTKAAAELGMTQGALSRQIQKLEAQLGTKLFERLGRGTKPTPACRLLLERLGPCIEEIVRLPETLEGATQQRVEIRLGALASIAAYALPPILKHFATRHPKTHLRLITASTEALPIMVAGGELDLALTTTAPRQVRLDVLPLWKDELLLVLPPRHNSRSRTLSSYQQDSFIFPSPQTGLGQFLQASFAERSIPWHPVMEHADLEVIKGLVAAGLGLSILPASSVRGETRRGELSAWPLVDLPVGIEVLLLTDPKRGSWDITNSLIESLQKYGKNTP